MPSKESQVMTDLFAHVAKYIALVPGDLGQYRLVLEELHTVTPEPTDVTYEDVPCPGTVLPAIWCKPIGASTKHIILYFHGGAFAAGSPASHRKVVGHLAKMTGCQALILDYRRAPEHWFPSQIDDAVAAFRWLRDVKGFACENIVTAGDSAGGNLSITTALRLKAAGEKTQAAIVGFSPWLDMKMRGSSYKDNATTDVLVNPEAITGVRAMYVGDASLDDPLIDLFVADYKGLPPMYLATGACEIVASDVEEVGKRAREAGVEVHEELAEGQQHLYFFMVGRAPEANNTMASVSKFLKEKLGL
ncbi:hypothetical protein SEUCBS139899_002062 [Sporothrix eucalyptigena]